ncbi:MAG: hypothetical protein Q8M39_03515 [Sulfuricurvum sp.]|nr:hypothetical protein [Sulfuricurvum sp.]
MFNEIILSLVLIEIVFFIFSLYVRKKNQWYIINKDKKPKFTKEILEKVLSKSYDRLLGWDRQPNTSGNEKGKYGTVYWNINAVGARDNLEYNHQKSFISLFGDSFTFAREVNDNETWGYKLSLLTQSNVQNFGVGNYGFDQALIKLNTKLKSENFRPEIVIIGVVPDTISRILSVWKHYYEYGNIFGFKPRYVLADGKIKLIDNIINSKDKFTTYEKYIKLIQQYDYFYKNKFLKEIITFPYSLHFFKNLRRNFSLSVETLKKGQIDEPTDYIMNKNLEYRVNLYKDKNNTDLLIEELKLFKSLAKEYNFKPCILVMPQKDDVKYIQTKKEHFYKTLIDHIPDDIICIDIFENLKEYSSDELDSLYSEKSEYGGHYSNKGNELISNILYEKLLKKKNDAE